MILKPIATYYKGYHFRSRLEARWAVFFDTLEITWEYEFEGFELPENQRYLPDFNLPTFDGGIWAEVKPDNFDFWKAQLFAETYNEKIWLCEGVPNLCIYKIIDYKKDGPAPGIWCGIPNWSQAIDENRMYITPCEFSKTCKDDCHKLNKIKIPKNLFHKHSYADELLLKAINKAKSARFEWGQNGE
jgi:hypothetical protein